MNQESSPEKVVGNIENAIKATDIAERFYRDKIDKIRMTNYEFRDLIFPIKEALDAKDIHWQEIVNHNEKIKMNPNFKNFIIGAIKEVNFIQGLDNELARMSALNRLSGYLEGGLEMIEFMEKENKNG